MVLLFACLAFTPSLPPLLPEPMVTVYALQGLTRTTTVSDVANRSHRGCWPGWESILRALYRHRELIRNDFWPMWSHVG